LIAMPAAPFSPDALCAATRAVLDALAPALATTPAAEELQRYVAALARFGAHTDLVGARTADNLAEIALADALVLVRHAELLRSPAWELGAGGASLSVPLALLVPGLTATMFEPRQKRATFLRMAVGTLGLAARLKVDQSRVEPARVPVGAAGCALARAVFPPDVWIPMASQLVAPGGAFAVLTTDALPAPAGVRVVATEHYALPFARAQRVCTWLSRAS
jgi:16S rRNA (guanine527-N7)-methyltransferase